MLKMSRERVERLARELLEAMTASQTVVLLKGRDAVQQAIAYALAEEFKREEEREETVRKKMSTMRKPARRSPQWQELFRKLMEEEYLREGLDS